MSRVIVIVQARMGSTRLPGKVLMQLQGKTVLEHVINRIKVSKEVDDVVIATTVESKDDCIVDEATRCRAKVFRGSQANVLSRYYGAANMYKGEIIIRITSDCPMIDPYVLDAMIQRYKNRPYDIMTNGGLDLSKRTYPRGLDVEIFSYAKLEEAFLNATESYQKEHVTPYIYENSNRIFNYQNDINYSEYRWTLDTVEDLEMITAVYSALYSEYTVFGMKDIISFLEENPDVKAINAHVEQKNYKE